jgi:hypothetical protein
VPEQLKVNQDDVIRELAGQVGDLNLQLTIQREANKVLAARVRELEAVAVVVEEG